MFLMWVLVDLRAYPCRGYRLFFGKKGSPKNFNDIIGEPFYEIFYRKIYRVNQLLFS